MRSTDKNRTMRNALADARIAAIATEAYDELFDAAEQREVIALLESLVGGESFYDFVARLWPDEPIPKHMRPIADAIERARVSPIRLCISLPPGHAKTTVLMRAIAWWIWRSPSDMCAYLTYSDKQARAKSMIALEGARLAGVALATDSASEWTTPLGGGLMARGIKAGITGNRVPGLLIVDDPYKDASEVESDVTNERVWDRLKQAAKTRLQGGSIIVVHTRWGDNDLIGRCVEELGWELINIPAVAEDPEELGDDYVGDPLGWRKPGDVAWPEKYPIKKCEGPCGHDGHLEEAMQDEWLFATMYQGRPRPKTGGMFQKEWFPVVEAAPEEIAGVECGGWDFAGTKKNRSPWTVRVRGGMVNGILYITHVMRVRVESAELPQLFEETVEADAIPTDFPQDPGQAGKYQVADLVKRCAGATLYWSPEGGGDKRVRAQPLAALARAGLLRLVKGEWNRAFILELVRFPTGAFADQVDACVRMYSRAVDLVDSELVGGSEAVEQEIHDDFDDLS